jgi:hypothetical protein
VQRHPALVVGVDDLVAGRRRLGQDAEPRERVLARALDERAGRDCAAAASVEAVAAGDDVAVQLAQLAVLPVADDGALPLQALDATTSDSKKSGSPEASRASMRSLTTSCWP